MYLHTDFNKRAEILLKFSKEQVMGKEFAELIDIIDFDREKVFLHKSLCLSYLICLYQSIIYALALTHFIPSSPPASLLHSSPTPPSFDLP
jgi:hypothetical protein